MAEVMVAGGVVVDIATKDDIAQHHDQLTRALPGKQEGDTQTLFGSSTAPASVGSGPLIIPFDPIKPPSGLMWALQWISIFTVIAGPAIANLNSAVAIGVSPLGPGAAHPAVGSIRLDPSQIVIPGLAVPTAGGVIIPGKVLIRNQQNLYCILQGAGLVVGTVYNATAGVIETVDTREAVIWA